MVSVVNDARKSELRRLLYGEMEQKASAIPASELRHMSADDRTLAASSLSPPSSVGYRWWLDNGLYTYFL